jgi:hypothetical protein
MPCLIDTDVLVDVSRNNQGAIACIDGFGNDWALSAMTAPELISGAKNQKEVELIDRLIQLTKRSRSMMQLEGARISCSGHTPDPTD